MLNALQKAWKIANLSKETITSMFEKLITTFYCLPETISSSPPPFTWFHLWIALRAIFTLLHDFHVSKNSQKSSKKCDSKNQIRKTKFLLLRNDNLKHCYAHFLVICLCENIKHTWHHFSHASVGTTEKIVQIRVSGASEKNNDKISFSHLRTL